MLSAITGSQGQGKSTTINHICSDGIITKIVSNTAREVISKFFKGDTLEKIYSCPEKTVDMQELVFENHYNLLKQYKEDKNYFIVERSFADLYTYALLRIGALNSYNQWLQEYKHKCHEAQRIFSNIFFLTGRTYTPEFDGVRSVNHDFSSIVDLTLKKTLHELNSESNIEIIDNPDLDYRCMKIIEKMVK